MKRAALILLACGSILHGQLRPFDFPPLPPNQHGGIAETAVSTDHSVPGGEVRTWRRAAGLHFERSGPRAFYRMQTIYPAGF